MIALSHCRRAPDSKQQVPEGGGLEAAATPSWQPCHPYPVPLVHLVSLACSGGLELLVHLVTQQQVTFTAESADHSIMAAASPSGVRAARAASATSKASADRPTKRPS